jgi:hypothetical protein
MSLDNSVVITVDWDDKSLLQRRNHYTRWVEHKQYIVVSQIEHILAIKDRNDREGGCTIIYEGPVTPQIHVPLLNAVEVRDLLLEASKKS